MAPTLPGPVSESNNIMASMRPHACAPQTFTHTFCQVRAAYRIHRSVTVCPHSYHRHGRARTRSVQVSHRCNPARHKQSIIRASPRQSQTPHFANRQARRTPLHVDYEPEGVPRKHNGWTGRCLADGKGSCHCRGWLASVCWGFFLAAD